MAVVIDEYITLVDACTAIPPESWSPSLFDHAYLTTVVEPDEIDEYLTFIYRWQLIAETPRGFELERHIVALSEGGRS